jgi:hypothetical protein
MQDGKDKTKAIVQTFKGHMQAWWLKNFSSRIAEASDNNTDMQLTPQGKDEATWQKLHVKINFHD